MINDYRFSPAYFSVDLSEFVLAGSDVVSFLDNQSTFNVNLLGDQDFHLAAFLDTQGKVETYGWLRKEGDAFLYLVPGSMEARTRLRLNKFLVSEDVEISESGIRKWTFILGGKNGVIFDEPASLVRGTPELPEIPASDVELWRQLNGWPSFSGVNFSPELINNTRLFDLALTLNKGCYPGQETVSKIATHRGAAYSPVLLETNRELPEGTITLSGNRIGQAQKSLPWKNRFFTPALLLRDFRVEGMKINFEMGTNSYQGTVRYYPLLKGSSDEKALELYDAGLEDFRNDHLSEAEKNLRKAIELNPAFADAYEALGVMLGRQERFNEAITLMEKLIEVDPDSSMAHTNLSLYLMRTGKIEEAENQKSLATLKSFKKFGEEAKLKDVAAEKARKEAKEWARREKMFLEVLEIDPEDTLANYGLGSLAVERGDWERARTFLEKVLAADPKYSVAYLALGKAYKGLGLADQARRTFSDGIKVAAAKGDFMPANQMQSELDRI